MTGHLLVYVAVPAVLLAAGWQATRNANRPRDPSTGDGYAEQGDPTHRAALSCAVLGGSLLTLLTLSTFVDHLP